MWKFFKNNVSVNVFVVRLHIFMISLLIEVVLQKALEYKNELLPFYLSRFSLAQKWFFLQIFHFLKWCYEPCFLETPHLDGSFSWKDDKYTDNFARVFVLKIFKMKQSVNKASKNEYQSKQNHRIFFKPNDHWHDNNQNQIDEDDS